MCFVQAKVLERLCWVTVDYTVEGWKQKKNYFYNRWQEETQNQATLQDQEKASNVQLTLPWSSLC